MKSRKRVFAVLMAVMMVFTYMPGLAYAAAGDGSEPAPEEQQVLQQGELQPESAAPDKNLADNDELLMEFLYQELAEKTGSSEQTDSGMLKARGTSAGDHLSGINKVVYDSLRKQLTAFVDADETVEAKTSIFDVTADEIFEGEPKQTVINGDLDVYEISNEDFEMLQEADGITVVDALLSDMPYEMYWFDKTTEYSCEIKPASYYQGADCVYFVEMPCIRFTFRVAAEYSKTGETGTTDFDVSKIQSVKTAVARAYGIIDSVAYDTDYEKIDSYKNRICGLVSYNDEAAYDESTPYGNPWQLIWVFDDKSSTNVVCEGYAKAFQFLCDNTDFENEIECLSVGGTMRGGTGEGPHMWNILHMDDDRNYIADLTNCDDGTIGAPDMLFLKGAVAGNVEDGYSYDCDGDKDDAEIEYVYDEETLNLFYVTDLDMSMLDYGEIEIDGDIVKKMTFTRSNGILQLPENTYGGMIVNEETGESYFEYYIPDEFLFSNGDTLTITYEDKNGGEYTRVYTYCGFTPYGEDGPGEQVFGCKVDGEWDTIDATEDGRLQLEIVQDGAWEVGGTGYYFKLIYTGKGDDAWAQYPVEIVENPIEAISFSRGDGYGSETKPIDLVQNLDGWTVNEGDPEEYFQYGINFKKGDTLYVKYRDESIGTLAYELTYLEEYEDWYFFNDEADENYNKIYPYDIYQESNSEEEEWAIGAHSIVLTYNGCTYEVFVNVVPNVVKAVSFERPGVADGEAIRIPKLTYEGYYSFDFKIDDILKVTYALAAGDRVVTYKYIDEERDENQVNGFEAQGEIPAGAAEFIEMDEQFWTSMYDVDGQPDPDEWTVGEVYNCKLSYMGVSTRIPVTLFNEEVHEHSLVYTEAEEPTCTEDGNVAYWTCSGCGKYFSDENAENEIVEEDIIIPATGHSYGDWEPYDEDQHVRICVNDSDHTELGEHEWDDGVVTTPATETTDGVRTYTCTACSAKKTEAIPATGPDPVDAAISEAESQTGDAAEKASAAENSTDENAVNAAVNSAEQAAALAEAAESAAEAAYNTAKSTLDNLPADASENERDLAKANFDNATKNLAVAKQIKAAANSAVASSKKSAAKIASSKAAAASEAAKNAADSATAEQYRKEAETYAAQAAEAAANADHAAELASEAAAGLEKLVSEVSDSSIAAEIKAAKDAAGTSAGAARTSAEAADVSSADAKAKEAEAQNAVKEKAEKESNPQPQPQPQPQTQPAPEPAQSAATVTEGQSVALSGSTYVVTSVAGKTIAFAKAKNTKTVSVPDSVMIEGESYKVAAINANAFKGAKIRSVVIGKNVKKIGKNAFKGSKAATITVKTRLLTKASIKGSLKGSKVRTVKVNISKKLNKSYVSKYKKIFTKANAGAKVTVK